MLLRNGRERVQHKRRINAARSRIAEKMCVMAMWGSP
jgi:hypothetical protein